MQNKSNLFLVGAAKSGTTSLFYNLSKHPNIFGLTPKEPMYFFSHKDWIGPGSVELKRHSVCDFHSYNKIVEANNGQKYIMDGSTDYLTSENSPSLIKGYNPKAKIVIVLRDPVSRAVSEYRHTVRDGLETNSFQESISLERSRYMEGYIPIFWHLKRGLYGAAVNRYFEIFNKDNILILRYEDMRNDKIGFYEKIYAFLDLPFQSPVNALLNSSGIPKNSVLDTLLKGQFSKPLKRALRFIFGIKRLHLIASFFKRLNSKTVPIPIDSDLSDLRDFFSDDQKFLNKVMGKYGQQ